MHGNEKNSDEMGGKLFGGNEDVWEVWVQAKKVAGSVSIHTTPSLHAVTKHPHTNFCIISPTVPPLLATRVILGRQYSAIPNPCPASSFSLKLATDLFFFGNISLALSCTRK